MYLCTRLARRLAICEFWRTYLLFIFPTQRIAHFVAFSPAVCDFGTIMTDLDNAFESPTKAIRLQRRRSHKSIVTSTGSVYSSRTMKRTHGKRTGKTPEDEREKRLIGALHYANEVTTKATSKKTSGEWEICCGWVKSWGGDPKTKRVQPTA